MSRIGFGITKPLFVMLVLVCGLNTPTVSGSSVISNEVDVIKALLTSRNYDEADYKAMVYLEQALQASTPAAGALSELGGILQQNARFEASKALFNAALSRYTDERALTDVANTLEKLAVAERNLANFDAAFTYLQRAMSIAHVNSDLQLTAKLNLELALWYQDQGQAVAALTPLKQSLSYFRSRNQRKEASECLLLIGDLYRHLNDTPEARKYYTDALDNLSGITDSRLHGLALIKIGALELKYGEHSVANTNIERGLALLELTQDVASIAEARLMMGRSFIEQGRLQEARQLINASMMFATSSGLKKLVKESREALAQAFMKEQNFERALLEAKEGTVSARNARDLHWQVRFLSIQLSALVSLGEFKKALDVQSVIQQLRQALADSENQNAIKGLQAEIELIRQSRDLEKLEESKHIALAQLEREKLESTLIWSLFLATLLMMFLIWSRFKQRQQTITLRREVRLQTLKLQEKNEELENAYKTLEEVSLRDPLTGLYNRHYLESQLPGEIKRSQFNANTAEQNKTQTDLLCLLIDIDHFKRINDDYGHMAGDKILTAFAGVLRKVFRQTDLIIRWGGEEFLVVCRQSNREELPELAERCRELVNTTPFDIGLAQPIHISCSIGFSLLPLDEKQSFDAAWDLTFSVIDYTLYAAKLSGRNGWVGIIETFEDKPHSTSLPTPFDLKFSFPSSRIATSFNNVASIIWPTSHEEAPNV